MGAAPWAVRGGAPAAPSPRGAALATRPVATGAGAGRRHGAEPGVSPPSRHGRPVRAAGPGAGSAGAGGSSGPPPPGTKPGWERPRRGREELGVGGVARRSPPVRAPGGTAAGAPGKFPQPPGLPAAGFGRGDVPAALAAETEIPVGEGRLAAPAIQPGMRSFFWLPSLLSSLGYFFFSLLALIRTLVKLRALSAWLASQFSPWH